MTLEEVIKERKNIIDEATTKQKLELDYFARVIKKYEPKLEEIFIKYKTKENRYAFYLDKIERIAGYLELVHRYDDAFYLVGNDSFEKSASISLGFVKSKRISGKRDSSSSERFFLTEEGINFVDGRRLAIGKQTIKEENESERLKRYSYSDS